MIKKAEMIIHKIGPGLIKYQTLMDRFHQVDVSADAEFQRLFNGFYRVRQRDERFYQTYYQFMEKHKKHGTTFEKTLKHLHTELNRIEASFSSKLLATLNPDMPIWDEFVLEKLALKKPGQTGKNRFEDTILLYTQIHNWYRDYVKSPAGKEIIRLFDETYPGAGISDVKKVDFVLCQIRE